MRGLHSCCCAAETAGLATGAAGSVCTAASCVIARSRLCCNCSRFEAVCSVLVRSVAVPETDGEGVLGAALAPATVVPCSSSLTRSCSCAFSAESSSTCSERVLMVLTLRSLTLRAASLFRALRMATLSSSLPACSSRSLSLPNSGSSRLTCALRDMGVGSSPCRANRWRQLKQPLIRLF